MDENENLTTTEETTETVDTSSETDAEAANPQEPESTQAESVDINAIAAAARRKSEERIKAIDAEYARRFGHLNNPITGQPIRSQADYLAALDAQEELQAKEQLQQNGVDPSLLDKLIANNPAVRQAQEVMQQAQRFQLINDINNQVAELSQIDPSIKSLETIPPDVIALSADRNMSLVDAYKLVNFGKVSTAQQAALTQQAINQAKGKSHLNPVNGVTTPDEGVDIPQQELAMWREYFPDKSEAELKKLYNKTI